MSYLVSIMNDDMAKVVEESVRAMKINPKVEEVSMRITLASQELIVLLASIKESDVEAGRLSIATAICGIVLVLTDEVDEALGILNKAREQIIDTEKEVNKG